MLRRAISKVVRLAFRKRRQVLFEPVTPSTYLNPGEVLRVERLDLDGAKALLDFRSVHSLMYARAQLRRGNRLYGAFRGDTLVAHGSIYGPVERRSIVNGYFPVEAGEILFHTFHVDQRVRGQGIYGQLLLKVAYNERREFPNAILSIDTARSNRSSIIGIRKAGFESVGVLESYRFGGLVHLLRRQDSRSRIGRATSLWFGQHQLVSSK